MAIERSWLSIPPRLLTADGTTEGLVTVSSTRSLRVKMSIVIQAPSLPPTRLQIKRVLSETQFIIGPFPDAQRQGRAGLSLVSDISAYTVALGSFVYTEEQRKINPTSDDIDQAVYEQEPVVAIRTFQVDDLGSPIGKDNPLPVIFDGTIEASNVTIQDDDGDELSVNPDGSINVNIVSGTSSNLIKNTYGEALAVASGAEVTITSYIVPLSLSSALLQRVSVSGQNVGRFQVFINNVVVDTKRTYFGGDFNHYFEFSMGSGDGYKLSPGDTVLVKILHDRPFIGDFEARIQALEIQ